MYEVLAIFAVFGFCYSSVAGAVERSWLSGPMVFTLFGLLIGPVGLDLLSLEANREMIKVLAEITLALVLFTDAASADSLVLRKATRLPVRLLLIGLPLTILLGFGVGALLLDNLSLFGMALLATMLAPTDAALGKAVVNHLDVPSGVRQGLNVESGLNDGICVPILYVFLALALNQAGDHSAGALALQLVAREIGIGLAVGLVLVFGANKVLLLAQQRHWLTRTWIQMPVIGLALSCFSIAQLLGGSGFIAAFCGGLLLGKLGTHLSGPARDEYLRASEGVGDTLALVTWVIFGSAVVGQSIGSFSWIMLLYAALSLTVIRMLPVFLCLAGSGISFEGKLFVGWFGPRGLASIVFAVVVLNSGLPEGRTLAMTVVCTIVLSILLHGITANAWARAYGRRRRLANPSLQ